MPPFLKFALRSWLYVLLHAAVAAPAARVLPKQAAFRLVKAALALASAASELWLCRAAERRLGAGVGRATGLLLLGSAGMFFAAPTFLPGTFTMVCVTAAAAAVLDGRPAAVVALSAAGVLVGWAVAAVAVLPFAAWVLLSAPLGRALGWAAAAALALGAASVAADSAFYGRPTSSMTNFLRYNVVGGGDSALYGTEGPWFYLHNGLLNLNVVLPLGLLPLSWPLYGAAKWDLLACVAPCAVWTAAISALPHKEERFLYVAYPLFCLAAASWICRLPALLAPAGLGRAGRALKNLFVAAALLLSAARAAAVLRNYRAPGLVFAALPEAPPAGAGAGVTVCVGGEWFEFPSSFYLPSPRHRLAFVRSGFDGLLPFPFDTAPSDAPEYFNDRNRAAPGQVADAAACDFLVGLLRPGQARLQAFADNPALGDPAGWEVLRSEPYLDAGASHPLLRALYVPFGDAAGAGKLVYGTYVLLGRRKKG